MKKLLGLLAAFGLTASAGTAVVSCDNGPKEDKLITEAKAEVAKLAKEKKFDDATAVQVAVLAVSKIDKGLSVVAVEGDLPEVPAGKAEAPVVVTEAVNFDVKEKAVEKDEEAKYVSTKFTVVYTLTPVTTPEEPGTEDKKDISKVTVEVKADEAKADVEDKILKAVQEVVKEATKADYDVTGLNETTAVDDVITVKAKDESTLIKGTITITVVAA